MIQLPRIPGTRLARGFAGYECDDSVSGDSYLLKALFINAPQLIAVSFYAQFFHYINNEVSDGIIARICVSTESTQGSTTAHHPASFRWTRHLRSAWTLHSISAS